MGNTGSNRGRRRNHPSNHSNTGEQINGVTTQSLQESLPQLENSAGNRYVFAAATPYPPPLPPPPPQPPQYPNNISPPQYYHYSGHYPPPQSMPTPLPAPFLNHHSQHNNFHHPPHHLNWGGGVRYPAAPMPSVAPTPYIEHQKAVTIRNDVNLKKETLRVDPDDENPGMFLVGFTFDATVAGSISVMFFAKEGFDCNLTATKENLIQPITVSFKEGLGQKFRQPPGTGINFSAFEEIQLVKVGESEVYPLAVKADASCCSENESSGGGDGQKKVGSRNSQITQAIMEKKESGEYHVRVVKQILWVNGVRYELQEIYGIGNSIDNDCEDGTDQGKECVICLSEPRDTTVLPCRHMCMCSECANVLRLQTNRCPICRQPVERLLEIKVNNHDDKPEEHQNSTPESSINE